MPGLFHLPQDRRAFLRSTVLGAATLVSVGRAAPGAGTESEFHVALISDTHIPADTSEAYRGFKPWENLRSIVPAIVDAKPRAVIHCGDAARLEGKPGDYEQLKTLLQPVAALAPIHIAMGNHDDRANFRKTFAPAPGPTSKDVDRHILVVEHEASRILVLDSLMFPNKTPGHLGKGQRDWLARYLPEHADRPTVIFVHHTLGEGDGELLDAFRLFELAEANRHVKAIFFGHSHVWELKRRGPLHLVNLPAVGYNFGDTQPVGWVDARFHPRGVRLTLRAIAGNRTEDGRQAELNWA